MSFNPIVNGKPVTALMNSNVEIALRGIGQNAIQQLQDRAVTFSADGGQFAEAYIDADGRKNSVVVADTTATFDTDKYYAGDLTGNTQTTGTGTADSNVSSIVTTGTINSSSGYFSTINVQYDNGVGSGNYHYKCDIKKGATTIATKENNNATFTQSFTFLPSDYSELLENGDTFSIELTRVSGSRVMIRDNTGSAAGTYYSFTSQPTPFRNASNVFTFSEFIIEESTITHTIPTGTFPDNMSTAFMTFKAAENDWESGADVQFKLINATEDTGWLNSNKLVSFTALTAEPTHVIENLIPKTTSPTAGKPASQGIFVIAGRPD